MKLRRFDKATNVRSSVVALCGSCPGGEAEVSARNMYGLSSVGIALDLSVSEETVKTYIATAPTSASSEAVSLR